MKNFGKLMLITAIMMLTAFHSQSQTSKSQVSQSDQKQTTTSNPGTFVDKDNNGVCDNFEARSGNGHGRNYIDKDGDGICDNRANVGKKAGNNCRNGLGNQHRQGQGRGRGCGNCCRR
jgi:hypothetical protein